MGAKLEERLVTHYGDEDRALDVLLEGNVAGLLAVKGMSQRQAVNLVQRAQGMKHGVAPADFLATDEAIRIYEELMGRLVENAHSDYARLKIRTLFPSSRPDLIERNRKLAILREMQTRLADSPVSSYDFIAEKREEVERELARERRWAGEE